MIRITSKLEFELRVPLPSAKGVEPRFIHIKPAKDGKDGVTELRELDNITRDRLQWHYEWRPTDLKNKGKPKTELEPDQIHEIGLLKVEIVDGKPKGSKPEDSDAGGTGGGTGSATTKAA